ncbi:MAG TPA: type II toxin-antitoxin system VapC family toxin [Burkholderiales bacterium]|nr:type II toxin-antitoxin system VapC family toxin [Burkholderiales bacterium]
MSVTVVDASAVAAVVFEEPEAAPLVAAVRGKLLAPSLIRYELANLCLAKLRQASADAAVTLKRYRLLRDLDLRTTEPDWHALPELAGRWGLSAYDAAYLDVALRERLPLVTLDARLARVYQRVKRA